MKNIFFVLCVLLTQLSFSQSEPREFIERVDETFQELLGRLEEDEKERWNRKRRDIVHQKNKLADEAERVKDIYIQQGAQSLYPLYYLNTIYDFELPSKIELTNSLGKFLTDIEVKNRIEERIDSLQKIFEAKAQTKYAKNLSKTFGDFILLRADFDRVKPDTLMSFIYAPQNNYWGSPYLIENYVVYDWLSLLPKYQGFNERLDIIERDIVINDYITIKDPLPIIPVMCQFAALIILITSLSVNFGFKARAKFVLISVLLSLGISVILLFVSPSTIWNSIINVFIPGVLYLIYYKRSQSAE